MKLQPGSDHRNITSPARDAEVRSLTLRTIASLIFTASAIFWGLFALAQFPWIDLADNYGSLVKFAERESAAGAVLFVLNILAISLTTGLLGRGRIVRFLTESILIATIAVSLWLYPTPAVWQTPIRLAVHATDLCALVLAIAANYLTRKPDA